MKTDLTLMAGPDKDRFEAFVQHDFLSDRSLEVLPFQQAIVVPGPVGGIVADEKYVVDSMSYSVRCPERFRIVPKASDVVSCDEDVLFLGSFESCWGHCITDNLKHLWVAFGLETEKYRYMKWVYTVELPEKPLPKNFVDLMAALDLPLDRLVRVDRPTRFRKVYIPQPCFYCDSQSEQQYRYYTKEFAELIQRIVARVDPERKPNPLRKVYLTRTGWKKGNPDFGERHVEAAFAQKGFEIVHPEDLSFVETVRLMGACHTLASTEGSTAHNSIFLQQGSKLVVLRKADYLNEYQPVIDQMRDLDVTYIDAHKSVLLASRSCPFSGPFFLYCNKNLAEYTGARAHFPVEDWLAYAWCGLAMRVQVVKRKVLRLIKKVVGGV